MFTVQKNVFFKNTPTNCNSAIINYCRDVLRQNAGVVNRTFTFLEDKMDDFENNPDDYLDLSDAFDYLDMGDEIEDNLMYLTEQSGEI